MEAKIVLTMASLLAGLSVFGMLSRQNFVFFLISVELLFNAAILSLVGLVQLGHISPKGIVAAIFLLAVGAAELAVGFAIAVSIRRKFKAAELSKLTGLRG